MADAPLSPPKRLNVLQEQITVCERCPELRAYCAEVAAKKRRSYREWEYWGRPVPGFGDPAAHIMIVGLAPAAHGANRTGRMFTGDRSGDFLFAALHRAGLANQAEATHRGDGLELSGAYITAALRCAPPGNKPTPGQRGNCESYLLEEFTLVRPRVVIALGLIGWGAALTMLRKAGIDVPRPQPVFKHGAERVIGDIRLVGCYHVSQQNTFTGRLTEAMIDEVLTVAKRAKP